MTFSLVASMLFGLITAVGFLLSLSSLTKDKDKKMLRGISAFAFIILVGAMISASFTYISAGNVGVRVTFGVVNERSLSSGPHLVNPLSKVHEMSVRTDNYWMSHIDHEGHRSGDDSVTVRSGDGLPMPVDVSVPYRLVPDAAPWVYANLGENYVEKLLRPVLSTATRRAASHYSAEELYSTKRDEFADKIHELIHEEMHSFIQTNYKGEHPPESTVIISKALVGHVGIPDAVKVAIENKLKADQEQQAMEFTIMKAKKEADRKQIEASGIQKFQQIVATGIDEKLLRWKAIEATLQLAESPNAKVVIIGSGKDGLPIILGNSETHNEK